MAADDIELDYTPEDPQPAVVRSVNNIAIILLNALVQGAIEAAKSSMQEVAKLFTLERLTGVLTEHMREMAGTWVSKTLIDASQAEWMGNLLHAFGIDTTDLLNAFNNSLDKGFTLFNSNLLTGLNQMGLQNDAVAGVWRVSFADHKAALSDAIFGASLRTGTEISKFSSAWQEVSWDSAKLQVTNSNSQAAIDRLYYGSVFSDTPEKITEREKLRSDAAHGKTDEYVDGKIDKDLPKILQTIGKKLDPIKQYMINQTDTMARSIMHLITSKIPVTPESGYANGITAFGMATAFGVTAHALCSAAELVHPLKTMGFNYIAAYLVDIANFAPISKASWGQYIDYAIRIPTGYSIRRELRSVIPDSGVLQELATKEGISLIDFERAMSYQGLSDNWINRIEQTMYRELTVREMSTVMEDTNITPAWVYKKMIARGYEREDAKKLADGMFDKYFKTYTNDYKSKLTNLYSSGYIREELFDAFLRPLNLRSEAVALMKKSADLQYIHDYIKETIIIYLDQFDKDILDESDLEIQLSSLGLEPKRLRLLLNRAKAKKAGKVAAAEQTQIKALIRQKQNLIIKQYTLAYQQGYITADELNMYLTAAGIDTAIVEITVDLETEKSLKMATATEMKSKETELAKIKTVYQAGYVDLYRKGYIDETVLTENLISLELDPEYIAALIETEQIKKLKPVEVFPTKVQETEIAKIKSVQEAGYIDLYRKGYIDETTLTEYLTGLALDPDYINALVVKEQIKKLKPTEVFPSVP